jgi:glycosyltransferase involved in cell wall biosynthesis
MRILMVSHSYPPTISGVTLVVQKLARAMVHRGHAVTIIAGSDREDPYEAEDQGVRLIRVRGYANPWWTETIIPTIGRKDLEKVLDGFQPDLVHAHEAGFLALQVLRLKQDIGRPLLATSYYVPRFAARYLSWTDEPQSFSEWIVWGYTIWHFNQYDQVVFATQAHRASYAEQGLNVPSAIISNGLDTTRYRPGDASTDGLAVRYRLPPRPRILFVSRLAKDKEIDVLLEAMTHVCASQPAHLLLVGRGDDQERLEERVASLGMEGQVHFLGFVPEADLPDLYRISDLFAIASIYEVQSLPTLQAVATGLPVVAADAMALPELVHHGINGFLVPPADPQAMAEAILTLVRDPGRAAQMGQAGLPIAAGHAESRTFDQYEALYERLLAGSPG